jgi:hypothetical protein
MGKKSRRRVGSSNKQRGQQPPDTPSPEVILPILKQHFDTSNCVRNACEKGVEMLAELYDLVDDILEISESEKYRQPEMEKRCIDHLTFIGRSIENAKGYPARAANHGLSKLVSFAFTSRNKRDKSTFCSTFSTGQHAPRFDAFANWGSRLFVDIARKKPNENFSDEHIKIARDKFIFQAESELRQHLIILKMNPTSGYSQKSVTKQMVVSVALDMAKLSVDEDAIATGPGKRLLYKKAVGARALDVCVSNHFCDDHFL